jgi:galactokinase
MWLMTLDEVEALRVHRQRFGREGRAFGAPARVNLIGEHTDYTGGFVMPMAIDFTTVAIISPRDDGRAVFYSLNFDEEVSFKIAGLGRTPRGHWSDYPLGVVWSLALEGVSVGGFSMSLAGNVPVGAGLSSSASLEVATAMALLSHAGAELPLKTVATLCRRTENEFVGAKSGIMDQFIVAGGVAGRVMLLDCRSLDFELLPLLSEVRVVVCNSMVQHQHAGGEYGDRRDEVEAGQAVLRLHRPEIELLRDATMADLEACKDEMSAASFRRCRHILSENARVLEAREALLRGDVKRFGELMVEAHASMRDDFAASAPEVDALVEIAMRQPNCFGARITGGGFGGCTVNLVSAEKAETFVGAVRREYKAASGIEADCFVSAPTDGALAMAAKGGVQ